MIALVLTILAIDPVVRTGTDVILLASLLLGTVFEPVIAQLVKSLGLDGHTTDTSLDLLDCNLSQP